MFARNKLLITTFCSNVILSTAPFTHHFASWSRRDVFSAPIISESIIFAPKHGRTSNIAEAFGARAGSAATDESDAKPEYAGE